MREANHSSESHTEAPAPSGFPGRKRLPGLPHVPALAPGPGRLGFTLLELITVLTLLGLILGRAVPAGRHLQDRLAVAGAREAAIGLFHRARMEAVSHGGSTLLLTVRPSRIVLRVDGVEEDEERLGEEYGVALGLSRGREETTLTFDAMGLGRVASQTLRFTRGGATEELTVSSYGRVLRR